MRRALFYIIFLALSMAVIAAPAAKKPRQKCNPALLKAVKDRVAKKGKAAQGGLAKAAPAKAPPPKTGGKKKRAGSDTTLCGMKIRGSSASMCQGNEGFIPNDATKKTEWTPWSTLQPLLAGNVPSKYQCDHALELQLTVKALESAGFCKAWTALQTAWNTWNPKGNAKTKMEEEFFRSLKFYANEPKMLFYVGSTFNGDKRTFTSNFLAGRPHPSSADLKTYFNKISGIVDGAAAAIDRDAEAILSRINAMAMPDNYDWETASAEDADYVCKLDLAETEFKGTSKPVATLWGKMKADIAK